MLCIGGEIKKYILILGLFSYPFLEVLIGGSILSQTGHAWGLGT